MKFLKECLSIHFKLTSKQVISFIITLIMAMLLSIAIVLVSQNIYKSNQSFALVKVTIVNNDNSKVLETAINFMLNQSYISNAYSVDIQPSLETANKNLIEGKTSAVVEIPKNFLNDMLTGKNTPPTLYLSSTQPFATSIVNTLQKSLTECLQIAQSNIYTFNEIVLQDGFNPNKYILDLNLMLINNVLNQQDFFNIKEIELTNNLTLPQHYITTSFVFFLMLTSFVFYNNINFKKEINAIISLKCTGANHYYIIVAKFITVFVCYFTAVLLFSFYFNFSYSVLSFKCIITSILSSALVATMLTSIIFVIFNVINNIFVAVITTTVFSFASLFFAGGILPPAILSSKFSKIGELLPVGISLKLITGYSVNSNEISHIIICVAFIISMLLALSFKIKAIVRKGFKNEVF